MNTKGAISLMRNFLDRSPRTALEVQVVLNDKHWLWRHGKAEHMESPVFEIGSVGKTFTTRLLALSVDRRKVSLTDPVARFYPEMSMGSHTVRSYMS